MDDSGNTVYPYNCSSCTPQSAVNYRKNIYSFLHSVDAQNKKLNDQFNFDTVTEEQPTVEAKNYENWFSGSGEN